MSDHDEEPATRSSARTGATPSAAISLHSPHEKSEQPLDALGRGPRGAEAKARAFLARAHVWLGLARAL